MSEFSHPEQSELNKPLEGFEQFPDTPELRKFRDQALERVNEIRNEEFDKLSSGEKYASAMKDMLATIPSLAVAGYLAAKLAGVDVESMGIHTTPTADLVASFSFGIHALARTTAVGIEMAYASKLKLLQQHIKNR